MSTRFLLVRHGMCDAVGKLISGRSASIHLNEEGQHQSLFLADRLSHLPIQALYSSPLERAQETATPLSHRLKLKIHCSEAFSEIDYGVWTGKTLEELAPDPLWQKFNSNRSGLKIPEGEMMLNVQLRSIAELFKLSQKHRAQMVAVFSHCDVIRAILLYYLGSSIEFNLRLEIAPASVSVLDLSEWGAQLIRMNDTGPLC